LLSLPLAAQFKDPSVLCQLAQFDVFLVSAEAANRHRAPKPYVFALKSRLPRAHFEDSAQWCHLVSTKTPDEAAGWVQTIIEAGVSSLSNRLGKIQSKLTLPLAHTSLLRTLSLVIARRQCSVPLPFRPSHRRYSTVSGSAAAAAAAAPLTRPMPLTQRLPPCSLRLRSLHRRRRRRHHRLDTQAGLRRPRSPSGRRLCRTPSVQP
jgi:hypothetical protein